MSEQITDKEMLEAIKQARMNLLKSGVQSYKIGSRSVNYMDPKALNDAIAGIDPARKPRFRRVVVMDK